MSPTITHSSACVFLFAFAQVALYADEPIANSGEQSAKESVDQPSEAAPPSVAPLSVAPLDQVEYPDDRPQWIEEPTQLDEFPHRWTVVSGPSETPQLSREELQLLQRASVETYLKSLPGAEGRFDFFPVTDDWIEQQLVVRRYEGEVTQEGLTLYEHAAELEIDRETEAKMLAALQNVEVRQRLGAMGVLVTTGLFGLICSGALVGMISRRVERRESVQAASI